MSGHRDPQSRPLAIPLACRQRGVPRAQTHPYNGRRGHRRRGSRRHLHDRPRGRRRPPPEDDDRQGRPGDLRPSRGPGQQGPARLHAVEGQRGRPAVEGRLRPDDGQLTGLAVADPEAPRDRGVRFVLQPEQRLHRRASGRDRRLHPRTGLVRHPGQQVRQEVHRDHGRLVRRDQGSHQQQRAAADRLGRLLWPRAAEIIRYTYTGWPPPTSPASPPCCATSTCPRSSTAPTATATGN